MDCHLMVGDKVVVVSGSPNLSRPKEWGIGSLNKEFVYTVKWVGPVKFIEGEQIGIRVSELIRWPNAPEPFKDHPFGAKNFRRVVDTTETVAEMARLMRQATKETVG